MGMDFFLPSVSFYKQVCTFSVERTIELALFFFFGTPRCNC